jgi:hypothetical protein
MKKLILLNLLILNFSLAELITFSKFGYDDITLYGPIPSATYFLKIGTNIDSSKSYIVLKFEPSPVLNLNESFITIYIWDKPATSFRISRTPNEIVIPLKKFELGFSEYLKIDIRASLYITDDRCKDIQTGGLWFKILKSSFINIEHLPIKKTEFKIQSFLSDVKDGLYLVFPSSVSKTELEGLVWVFSFVRKVTGIKTINYATFETLPTKAQFIAISIFEKLPNEYKILQGKFLKTDGLIYIYSDRALFITGFSEEGLKKALQTFLNLDILKTSFNSFLLVREAKPPEQPFMNTPPFKVPFKGFGFSTSKVEGIGSLRSSFTFTLSKLGFSPDKININISAVYSPVTEKTGRAYMNVYFNGLLIESKKLGEEGKIIYSFSLNRFSLLKLNTISIEFTFYPSSEDCINKISNFFYMINDESSYIEVKDIYRPKELDFSFFPEMFTTGETVCAVSKNLTVQKIKALSQIIHLVNSEIKNSNFFPEIITTDNVTDETLENYNLIIIADPKDDILNKFSNIVVKPKNDFKIISASTKKILYALYDTSSIGVCQVFYSDASRPVLVLMGLGENSDHLLSEISDVMEKKFITIEGNVGIVDLTSKYHFFKVESGLLKVNYPGEKTFLDYFNQYKVFLIIIVWFLFLSLLTYIFFRGRKHATKVTQR